jgi:outer membrane protein assembly factor BamB
MKIIILACNAILAFAIPTGFAQQILWQVPCPVSGSLFYGSPAVASDGTIYLATQGPPRTLLAYDPSGRIKWSFAPGSDGNITPPVVGADGTIYFGGSVGATNLEAVFYAVKPDGSPLWVFETETKSTTPVGAAVADDGTVYFSTYPSKGGATNPILFALNPSGSIKWVFKNSGQARTPAIGRDGTVYLSTHDGLYAVNPDGSLYWTFPTATGFPLAIDSDGMIFVPGESSGGFAVNPDGFLSQSFPNDGFALTGPDGLIYLGPAILDHNGGYLHERGVLGQDLSAECVAADDTVYGIGRGDNAFNALCAMNAYNGGIKWEWRAPRESSILRQSLTLTAGGVLYFTWQISGGGNTNQSMLVAMKVFCGLANAAWPMPQHDLRRSGQAGPGTPVRPFLAPIRWAASRGYQFAALGEKGLSYQIQASFDLVAWTTMTNYVCASTVSTFTDPAGTNSPQRFYRVFPWP